MTTQFAEASYQEIIDLHTESDTVSVVGIHTPLGTTPTRMLKGFYTQFKKFKYDGCSISLVPAARLPADPSQLSISAGEPAIDARDMLNPIMFHGCHGNDMGTILNTLYSSNSASSTDVIRTVSDSVNFDVFSESQVGNDYVDALYYKALTDNTWAKAHPQRGFRKSGLKPMVYSLASNAQIANSARGGKGIAVPNATYGTTTDVVGSDAAANGSVQDMGFGTNGAPQFNMGYSLPRTITAGSSVTYNIQPANGSGAGNFVQFFTPRLQRLGWMDTREVIGVGSFTSPQLDGTQAQDATAIGQTIAQRDFYHYSETQLPRIYMGMIMLPPAYRTEQYFRLILHHHFSFKNFRGMSFMNDNTYEVNNAPGYYNFNSVSNRGGTSKEASDIVPGELLGDGPSGEL